MRVTAELFKASPVHLRTVNKWKPISREANAYDKKS